MKKQFIDSCDLGEIKEKGMKVKIESATASLKEKCC